MTWDPSGERLAVIFTSKFILSDWNDELITSEQLV